MINRWLIVGLCFAIVACAKKGEEAKPAEAAPAAAKAEDNDDLAPNQATGESRAAAAAGGKVRDTGEFQLISFAAGGELEIRIGEPHSVTLDAPDEILAKVITQVRDTTLRIECAKDVAFDMCRRVNVVVVAPEITGVSLAGSGDVNSEGALVAEDFELSLAGSGDAVLDLDIESLVKLSLSGSGNATLNGKAGTLDASLAGSGDLFAASLKLEDANIDIAGSGSAEVHVGGALDVSIAGSGNVTYTGGATLSKSVTGSGTITKR